MNTASQFAIKCRAVILHEGRLLLVRHPHDTSFAALPGGHLEQGEDPKECLRREIMEELGIEPTIGRLLYINTFTDQKHYLEFFFEVTNGEAFTHEAKIERTHAFELAETLWANPTDDIRILPTSVETDFRAGKLLSDEIRYTRS